MAKYVVNVTFHFIGKGWTRSNMHKAKDCFMSIRDDCIKVTNPKIEELNSLWNCLYPGADLVNNDEEMKMYNNFMARHFNELTEDIRNKDKSFKGYFDPDLEAEFVLLNKRGGKMYFTFTFA